MDYIVGANILKQTSDLALYLRSSVPTKDDVSLLSEKIDMLLRTPNTDQIISAFQDTIKPIVGKSSEVDGKINVLIKLINDLAHQQVSNTNKTISKFDAQLEILAQVVKKIANHDKCIENIQTVTQESLILLKNINATLNNHITTYGNNYQDQVTRMENYEKSVELKLSGLQDTTLLLKNLVNDGVVLAMPKLQASVSDIQAKSIDTNAMVKPIDGLVKIVKSVATDINTVNTSIEQVDINIQKIPIVATLVDEMKNVSIPTLERSILNNSKSLKAIQTEQSSHITKTQALSSNMNEYITHSDLAFNSLRTSASILPGIKSSTDTITNIKLLLEQAKNSLENFKSENATRMSEQRSQFEAAFHENSSKVNEINSKLTFTAAAIDDGNARLDKGITNIKQFINQEAAVIGKIDMAVQAVFNSCTSMNAKIDNALKPPGGEGGDGDGGEKTPTPTPPLPDEPEENKETITPPPPPAAEPNVAEL